MLTRAPQAAPTALVIALCVVGLAPGLSAQAVEDPSGPTDSDSEIEIVITGTRLSDSPFEQPYALYRLAKEELDRGVGSTLLDRANYGPGVFIQRTAPNQASPFVRGLTGEQTLLLLDGVRLSHAFMRPGPNQYSALVPDASVQSIDFILGSSSVVTGSDGLTGAINFNLADAARGIDRAASTWARTRVDSANGAMFQTGLDGTVGNWAYSVEFDGRDYHDRVGGKDFDNHVFGVDTDTNNQIPNTSYEQLAGGLRLSYGGFANHVVEVNSGYTQQTDAKRPDGYFENTGNAGRISRSFDPQEFSYLHIRDIWQVDSDLVSELRTTVWWHRHFEDQTRDEIRDQGTATELYRLREKQDELHALGLDIQGTTLLGDTDSEHEVTWGITTIFEETNNDFEEYRSPAGSTDPTLATAFEPESWGNRTTVSDNSKYRSFGLFIQDSWDVSEAFNLLYGARYSYYEWEFGDVDGDASDVTGSVRGMWRYAQDQNVFVGLSKAFRAPNLTNLDGAVDRGSSGAEATGNPNLDPEESYTAEVGWKWRKDRDVIGVSVFYTFVDELIQRDFAGNGEFENVQDAEIQGFETVWDLGINCLEFIPEGGRLSFFGAASLVDATKDVPQVGGGTREDNISRANRFYGRFGFKYDHARTWWCAIQCRWADDYDDVAEDPSDPDSSDIRLTVAGSADGSMPGYGVVDAQLGWRSEDGQRDVTLFIENIFDRTYRDVGSGADAPGLNLGITAGIRF
ncbi:MAG: TonB-dependent receptor [Planctomycetota bacterium]